MEKKLPERKLSLPKGISEKEASEYMEWAQEYCEVFEDRYYCKLLDSILFKRTMTKAFVELSQKRMNNISLEEIRDPTIYIHKYKKYLSCLITLEKINQLTGKSIYLPIDITKFSKIPAEDYHTIIDLISFFQKAGYYTDKQLNLIMVLWRRYSGENFKDCIEKLERFNLHEIESIFKSKILTSLAKKAKKGAEVGKALLEEFFEEKEEKREKIVQKFFSLDKIRENLQTEIE